MIGIDIAPEPAFRGTLVSRGLELAPARVITARRNLATSTDVG
jgi:hypothetical protein